MNLRTGPSAGYSSAKAMVKKQAPIQIQDAEQE